MADRIQELRNKAELIRTIGYGKEALRLRRGITDQKQFDANCDEIQQAFNDNWDKVNQIEAELYRLETEFDKALKA